MASLASALLRASHSETGGAKGGTYYKSAARKGSPAVLNDTDSGECREQRRRKTINSRASSVKKSVSPPKAQKALSAELYSAGYTPNFFTPLTATEVDATAGDGKGTEPPTQQQQQQQQAAPKGGR